REARLEAEDELVDVDRASAELHGAAEEAHARECAVDDVQVDGGGEHEDEQRGEREIRDERPARGGLAEDLLDRRGEGLHDGSPSPSGGSGAAARTRSTKTSSRLARTGVSSWSLPPEARRRSTIAFR